MRKLVALAFIAAFAASCGKTGVLNKNLIFPARQKGGPGDVVFSHRYHVKVAKLHCSSCHPRIFKQKFGYDRITMQAIWNGRYCGECHNGNRAFSARNQSNCKRCHSR